MAFEPDKITEDLIQKAVEKIEKEKIQLEPSTKFDVIINSKAYPPKEIMRYAHELLNGEHIWELSGGETTNKFFTALGFEIKAKQGTDLTGNLWKLGCNWGKGMPSFYSFIKEKNIVIGVDEKKYNKGDLILVCEGQTVKALARIEETPISVTTNRELEKQFINFKIEYEDWVNYAKSAWYELKEDEVFHYQLQQGIVRVQNREVYEKALNIWNNRHTKKMNYKQQYTSWLNSTNKEGSQKANSYIRAIDILTEVTKKNIFEEDNLTVLNALYDDLLNEQDKTDGKYYYPQAPSYGTSRFYSAAIKTYSDFLTQLPKTEIAKTVLITNMPLNSILYGPPGTGKTFNSIDKAVAIATGSSSDHISNKKQFDDLRKLGQIEFVTFHQNYSYEDFMVGIRPNVIETTSGLSFKKHYGIFYEIAKRARENFENSLKDEQTISRENWVKEKFEDFKEYVETELEENGKFTIKNNVSIYSVEDEVFIYTGEKENGELWKNQRIGMHYDALINIYLADVQNRQDIKKLENVPSLEKQHATYSFELIEKFREFLMEKGYKFQSTTVQKEHLKNFVLIIDEINRANISKVFGELITLLEDDKRIGEPNELKITLPNGEKEFGVPPNLYLIGTMNTADKSIALIDIALRRRFEFIGKYPDYDEIKNVDAKNLLQKINEEIYKLKNSADYLIGHAYFMKGQAIEETLRNKIVPLLMEYFSGKTKIVSDIFNDTNWKVEYDTTKFNWTISTR
jgi:5-methylcytosine-specific restriction endonuclease McrBC GTP-binding regulatory subunit McrB